MDPFKWQKKAEKRWPNAEWITGEGKFAVLAHCRRLTVTLWPNIEKAEEAKQRIDETACGGHCTRDHEIVDLSKSLNPGNAPKWGGKIGVVKITQDELENIQINLLVEIFKCGKKS